MASSKVSLKLKILVSSFIISVSLVLDQFFKLLALVISGGIGNLIDRVTRGYVIDFIFMGIGPLHTGVFNIADIAITSGLIMMLYEQYRMEKETK